MAHPVKCYYCEKTFDRDKVPFKTIPFGKKFRYAHEVCPEPPSEERQKQIDEDNFFQVVKRIYGPNYDYHLIETQGLTYINKYNYTWTEMGKALHWFYEIQKGSKENSYGGIGIIPYIYDKAKAYYEKMDNAQEKNNKVGSVREPVYFNIQSPRAWSQPPHLLDMEDDE